MTNQFISKTRKLATFFAIAIILAMAKPLCAQTDSTPPIISNDTICLINHINITGNKKTKAKTILCELEFEPGDTVSVQRMPEIIEKSRINLLKTSIFNYVTISFTPDDSLHAGINYANIDINVEECWYTWPLFDITPHTGNLNEWVAHPDFDLIDYHIGLKKYNFCGRREAISILFRRGFNNITQIGYENIAIDSKRKHMISLFASVQKQNNVMIDTENDKAVYRDFDGKEKAFNGYEYHITYKYRPTIDIYNSFSIGYLSARIRDSVAIENPDFFGNGRTKIDGITLTYSFKLDKRSSSYYPLTGSYLSTEILKYGLFSNNIDNYKLNVDARKYLQLSPRQYAAAQFCGSMSSYSTSFYLMDAIGYKPYIMPGYEHNMIKARCISYLKTSYKFELVPRHIVHLKWLPLKKFNKIHYAVYINAFANAGYASPQKKDSKYHNSMNDTFLGALGIGMDFVTYYDRVLSAFVTRNIQGGMYVGVGFKSSF